MTSLAALPWVQLALAGALAVAFVERLLRFSERRHLHHVGACWAAAGVGVTLGRVLARLDPTLAVAGARLEWLALLGLPLALALVAAPRRASWVAATGAVAAAGAATLLGTDQWVGGEAVARRDLLGHVFWVPRGAWLDLPATLWVGVASTAIAAAEIRRTADPVIRASLSRGVLPALVGATLVILVFDRAVVHGWPGVQLLPWTVLAAVVLGESWNARRAARIEHELEERVAERTEALRQEHERAVAALAEAEAARRARAAAEAARDRSLDERMAAERMVALGVVGRGVAHEINNPLQQLSANLEFLRGRVREPDAADALDDAVDGVARIADAVRRFRALADRGERAGVAIDPNAALLDAARLVDPELRDRADLRVEAGVTPLVRGDEAELAHALVHLMLTAARRAAPAGGPRAALTARTRAERGGVAIEILAEGAWSATDPGSPFGADGLGYGRDLLERSRGELTVEGPDRLRAWLPAAEAATPGAAPVAARPVFRLLLVHQGPTAAALAKALRGVAEVEVVSELPAALDRWIGGCADAVACGGGCGVQLLRAVTARRPWDAHRVLLLLGADPSPDEKRLAAERPDQVIHHPLDRAALIERLKALGPREARDAGRA